MSDDLYAPLPTSASAPEAEEVCADETCVVSPLRARWPARCVVCNGEPASEVVVRPRYIPMLAWGLVPLLAAVLAFVPSGSTALTVSLCGKHRSRRTYVVAAGVLAVVSVPLTCVFSSVGLPCMAGAVVLAMAARPVGVVRIERGHGWFVVGEPFRASLPRRVTSQPSLED